MTARQDDFQEQIDSATQRLLRRVRGLVDEDVRQASSLPGWTRGHVLAHLARNADALRNLLGSARTGVPVAAYVSQEARDAAIEAGAGRGVVALLADLTTSAERFRSEAVALPEQAWQQRVQILGGTAFPAIQLLERRLVEVELHHTDLDAGYRPQDWPTRFADMELAEPMRTQRDDRAAGRTGR